MASSSSPYPGLTEEKVQQLLEDEFTPAQIDKVNKRELTRLDANINAMTLTRRGPVSTSVGELRLVLLGKTGAGKSSLGNLVLGQKIFKDSFGSESCTSTIDQASCDVDNIHVKLIDTPGLIDTGRSTDSILTEVAKVVESFSNGIHGFLFVFNLGNPRFTTEEKKAFQQIEGGLFGPKFLDHCFVVITNGSNLYSKTTLTAYLDGERMSDFGHLLNNTIGRKVIAVENSEETAYGRSEQRQQVIRMIVANINGVYTNEALNEYKEDQEATAARFKESVRELAPEIEAALFDELKRLPHERIKEMTSAMRTTIIESALEKVMQHWKAQPGMEDMIRDALNIALTEKIKRLTDPSFLQKVADFAVGLLTAAGQMVLSVLEGIASVVGAVGSAAMGFVNFILGN